MMNDTRAGPPTNTRRRTRRHTVSRGDSTTPTQRAWTPDSVLIPPPSYQPDRALSALTYGLTPICNLSQSCYGRTPIACAHTTGNSNTHLSQVSYRNLLISQYKQGCNQCEHSHTQVYHNLNTHQLHLNAPYKHLSVSVSTSPAERTT
jgi:hypothetical protein